MFQKCSYLLLVICFALLSSFSYAQDTKYCLTQVPLMDYFRQPGRPLSTIENYPRQNCIVKKHLKCSPNYADIKIFLGRLYTWTNEFDSAKNAFESVMAINPSYEDVYLAYADLLYWNDHYKETVTICDYGLKFYPE
jgi:cytochrome c-type biogenesis protein CcmH/NrfG